MNENTLGVENLADRGAGATSYCLCSRENDTGIEELDLRSTVAVDTSGLVSGMYYCAGCRSSELSVEELDTAERSAEGARMCYPCGLTEPVLEALDTSDRGGEGARICHGPCRM